MKDISILQKPSEVSARFHLVRKSFRSSPFFTRGFMILTVWFSKLVRFNPCAEEFSCMVTCNRRAKSWGCQEFLGHTLRHCHATLLDAAGAPLGTVQALLGHSSPEVTRQIYLHAIQAEQRRAVEGVEKLLVGPKWTQIEEVTQRPNLVSD